MKEWVCLFLIIGGFGWWVYLLGKVMRDGDGGSVEGVCFGFVAFELGR